ncbi:MAG: hypothetical protein BWX85_00345 [Chloroflexi bacterium ADurb.Bin120]|jgi:hypothetical protein|nr:MAG: hypothetical protein BWX85_00345 [Chloroflexi bacterium ADurb.Bin120]
MKLSHLDNYNGETTLDLHWQSLIFLFEMKTH